MHILHLLDNLLCVLNVEQVIVSGFKPEIREPGSNPGKVYYIHFCRNTLGISTKASLLYQLWVK